MTHTTKQTFDDLLRETAAVAQQVRELDTLDGFKLSAKDFLREAIMVAHTAPERLAAVRKEVEGTAPGLDHARQALRKMIVLVKSRNCTGPPRELRRLNYLMTADAIAEIASLRATTFELFAVAVQITAEKFPADFGTATSSEGVKSRLLELTLKRDALFDALGTAYGPGDIAMSAIDNERGTARVSFRMTNGEVCVFPANDCGKRLVEWCLAHETVEEKG